ncbi:MULTISPECIES: hypothetical protein [unclassified Novosphingobium]|uniref:hypothetical protein n=1 Tax=unclassified Novosphingobium TaxID=2644732 RepID=UPI001448771B|nr:MULTISPECIES: hypothetical protein [unclassified Novosphingobium]NKJ41802.1 hypothetical protein [Novosphingobium sp. SG720]NMN04188.1 hypothetical protein [Novosphingobium sp. SG919]NMN85820.1 hypothetical protein [Novosphingobium sp. SG916]
MTGGARVAALITAGLVGAAGLALHLATGNGWGLIGLGAVIALATLFEARYRARQPEGAVQWQRTGECEVDVETGAVVEVWYDPVTGARKYEPVID